MSSNPSHNPVKSFECFGCGRAYPSDSFPYRCENCGGIYDDPHPLRYQPPAQGGVSPGIERYRQSFPLDSESTFYSLGEGNTPLVDSMFASRPIHIKCEHQNPTGSFKDRGTAVLISALAGAGVESAVEDSSGNAGASFAAYAARAGIEATVYIPEYASGPKKAQIEAYGAEVVRIPGPRSAVSEAVKQAADGSRIYASHAYLPHGIAGMATIAYELIEQLGRPPGSVLTPVGQGSLFLGLHRGFIALREAGIIEDLPQLVGVQALACAPIWAVYSSGAAGLTWMQEGETIAEGIRIFEPLRGDHILKALDESKGFMVAVDEAEIIPARDELALQGLYVEPTSAVVWAALKQCLAQLEDPIVLVLTGHGLKSPTAD